MPGQTTFFFRESMKLLKRLLTFIAAMPLVVAAGFYVHTTAVAQEVLTTESVFENELQQRGIPFSKIEKHLYDVRVKRITKRVSLNNIDKSFTRDGNVEAVKKFAASIVRPAFVLPSTWDAVKENIFVTVMAAETRGLDNAVYKKLSRKVVGALAYYDRVGSPVYLLSPYELDKLNVSQESAWNTAQENLEKIAQSSTVSFAEVNGQKLGVIETLGVYKASMILTRELRSKVEKELGWPVYAVAPARDFVYLFSKAGGMMGLVSGTVIKEYQQSGNPLSTEVWELSDNKQTSVVTYAVK